MSADRFREAAALLRERAEKVDPSTGWSFSDGGTRDDGTRPGDSALIEFITMMSPPVALALADWLDDTAGEVESHATWSEHALAVADAILGADR